MITLKSPKAGQVVELYVREGQQVSAGQKLLRLDDDDERKHVVRLKSLEASFLAVEASLSGEIEERRVEALLAIKTASEANIQATEVALNGVREEARVGQRTVLDVLNAQLALVRARDGLIEADTGAKVASKEFDHRRRGVTVVLKQLTTELEYWGNELERLTIVSPANGRIRLTVERGSTIKLSGVLATVG